MSPRSKTVLATQEDLDRIYGSEQLLIGSPVRPKPSTEPSSQTPPEQQPNTPQKSK